MKTLVFTGILALLLPARALAQTPRAALTTPTGHELSLSLDGYNYVEPLPQHVSMHGLKVGAEYTGTRSLSRRRHWFVQADVRGTLGPVAYDGYCSPWIITPDRASPNGYALGVGASSPCSESGDQDWYAEARGLVGKDVIGWRWGLSPFTGVGFRHLSNGTDGIPGYRTDNYLYVPVGLTTRPGRRLSVTLEYDRLVRGWQKTRESRLGGGVAPATATTPGFTINGFSDVSFAQHGGWALRASATYRVTGAWSVEPYYIRWSVGASPVNPVTATFTVNGITAQEQLGYYEPFNTTNELGVKLGFHF